MSHPRILLVDDDEAILDSLRRALELEGYAVRTAVDGAGALTSVAENEPDAVVLDIGLPDLNGRIVAARMRAGGLSTPILVLSALDQVDDRIAGLEAGADDYLVKPFAIGELVARLRALLRRAAAREHRASASLEPPVRLGLLRRVRVAQPVILRSLTARVVVGAMLVVSVVLVGGGLMIVTSTEQRDKRDADADLHRFAGNLTPGIAGVLGVNRPPPSSRPALAPGPLVLLDRSGRPVPITPGPAPPPVTSSGPAPGVAHALVDAFNERGRSSAPAGEIVFVRAVAVPPGRHLILGAVPAGFPPMSQRVGGYTVHEGGKLWRLMVVRSPIGVTIEVAALAQSISARAMRLRTIVIWTGIVGLLVVLVGTVITSRLALRPLTELTRKAAGVEDTEDLGVKLRASGQPREVAVLADELDGMLSRLDEAVAAREAGSVVSSTVCKRSLAASPG